MALSSDDCVKQEKINGIVYHMSPSGGFLHGQVSGNICHTLRKQLRGGACAVSVENLDLYLSEDEYVMLRSETLRAMPAISIIWKDAFERIE